MPFRSSQLGAAHAGHHDEHPHSPESIALGRVEEGPELAGVPDSRRRRPTLGRLTCSAGLCSM
jgi:hypothetical protein